METARVLLAEDSELLAEIMKDFLDLHGFDVSIAKNGMEALAHPALHSVDIIIMDIEMPVMGGVQAASQLRASGFTKPILAYSGSADFELRSDFLAAGFSGHMKKPVDFPEFVSLLHSLLPAVKFHESRANEPSNSHVSEDSFHL